MHGGWHGRWKAAHEWKDLAFYAARAVAPVSPVAYARVTITLVYVRKPLKDLDNAYGSIKHILDGIVQAKLLLDDSPAHISLHVTQVLDATQKKHVHIAIDACTEQDLLEDTHVDR